MSESTQQDQSDLIRLAEVMRLSGWNKEYIRKLRDCGSLQARQLVPDGWWWYSRSQVLGLISPKGGRA